jgi:hypothetical protein
MPFAKSTRIIFLRDMRDVRARQGGRILDTDFFITGNVQLFFFFFYIS